MKTLKKIFAMGVAVAMLAVIILPRMSFAENYVVSPSFVGNSSFTTAMATQVCASLPDAVAAQQSFCSYSTHPTTVSIADNAILIKVTSSTSAIITWNTPVMTTSSLTYMDNPMNTNLISQYTNTADGSSYTHTVVLTGIDLTQQHLFQVSGIVQGTSSQISSRNQVI